MDVVRSRARLIALSEHWGLENRSKVLALKGAIEGTINHAFAQVTIRESSREKNEFQWSLPVAVESKGERSIFPVTLSLKRKKDDSGSWGPWGAEANELEAVLYLWISSLTETKRERAQARKPTLAKLRLLGPATDESRADYKLWVNRGTTFKETPGPPDSSPISTPDSNGPQHFGQTGHPEDTNKQHGSTTTFIYVDCRERFEKLCSQDIYGWFISDLAKIIGGITTSHSSDPTMEHVETSFLMR